MPAVHPKAAQSMYAHGTLRRLSIHAMAGFGEDEQRRRHEFGSSSQSLRPPSFWSKADLSCLGGGLWVVLEHVSRSNRNLHLGLIDHNSLHPPVMVIRIAELCLGRVRVRDPLHGWPRPALEDPTIVHETRSRLFHRAARSGNCGRVRMRALASARACAHRP